MTPEEIKRKEAADKLTTGLYECALLGDYANYMTLVLVLAPTVYGLANNGTTLEKILSYNTDEAARKAGL